MDKRTKARRLRSAPVEERFWAWVDKVGGPVHPILKTRCWTWTGAARNARYGKFSTVAKRWMAHQFSWTLNRGPIPDGFRVLHRCDNTHCVRPDHLFLGTQADNVADMVAKERHSRGESNGHSSLTEKQVRWIRHTYVKGSKQFGSKAIGKILGVSYVAVLKVIYGQTWKHVR